jgi:hypothetical protein
MQEYQHARSAMRMLQDLLAELERTPGRKNLILFSQNGATYPDVFYGHPGAPDLYAASQELAAAATGSQTVMYGANLESDPWSPIAQAARVLNDELADFTGGGFNRGAVDLARFTDRVGRGCRCVYRIGLVPPKNPTTEVRTARIVARGVPLDFRYRVRFTSERERWMRDAQAVLADPAGARALKVSAAIVPESADKGSWSVSVEVAFDTRSLTLLPSAAGRAGGYEIGALLSSRNGSKPVEMIEGVNLREREGQDGGGLAVHTLRIEDLDPGDYRLAAFVRDRALNVFGGAEALLTLPSPKKGGAAGPVLLLGPQPRTVLPLGRMSSGGSGGPSPRPASDAGVVPMIAGDLRPGERLSGMTWICPGKKKDPPTKVLRFLAQEGTPLFRFESSPPATAGECLLYADVLDTRQVKADAYAYHVLWRPDGEPQPVDASAVFEIVDPGREAAGPAGDAQDPAPH